MARNSLKSVCKLIDAATHEEPVEKTFLRELQKSIEMTDDKNRRLPSQTYKPSSLGCIRNMYYQVTGQEPKSSANYVLIGICESGTDRHERIQNAVAQMKDNGFDCEYLDVGQYIIERGLDKDINIVSKQGNETKLFHKEFNMSFLCDGIIRYKGHYYIIEFKTESIYKWSSRREVNPDHYNQAIAYSTALGIDNVLFVYINRDNTDMKAYMYDVTPDMKEGLIQRIRACDEHIKKQEVPPLPDPLPKHSCQYCGYAYLCKEDR